MVFKAVAGVEDDVYKLYCSRQTSSENKEEALDVTNTFHHHYKNRIVSNWKKFKPCEVLSFISFSFTHSSNALVTSYESLKPRPKGRNNSQTHCWAYNVMFGVIASVLAVVYYANGCNQPSVHLEYNPYKTLLTWMRKPSWRVCGPTMLEELCKSIQYCCATLRRSRNETLQTLQEQNSFKLGTIWPIRGNFFGLIPQTFE